MQRNRINKRSARWARVVVVPADGEGGQETKTRQPKLARLGGDPYEIRTRVFTVKG